MFKVACFVRVSDSERRDELLRWCVNLGYTYIFPPREEKYSQGVVCDTECVGVAHDAETFTLLKCVDCGENIELFKALAAMNDENDREQWFVCRESYKESETLSWKVGDFDCYHLDEDYAGEKWRKATLTEILEHFKTSTE